MKGLCIMDANELLAVYSTNDARDAEILRGALHAQGIKCEIDGASQAGLTGLGIMEIKVLVRAEDFDRAKSYVEKHEHWHVPSPAAD
jgi:ribosomal protein S3